MHILAFEPMTGAITAFALQKMITTRPARIIPHSRVVFRRHRELLHESVLSEVSDTLVDALSANPHVLLIAIFMLVVWHHHHRRQ
jgi:hypothetical protein